LFKWGLTSASFYVIGGCLILLFLRALAVPAPVKVVVGEVANASMFIYLSHYQMISIVTKLFGEPRPWIALTTSIIVGVMITRLYGFCARKFTQAFDRSRTRAARLG
ncbi:hypothetical protein, partial [Phaeobacter sp. HF9A]|uniref:hypothetical protein n=1 Tax=Phaeobacter sp. HF9A TaxID=2721561 RepID=UPI001C37CF09